MEARMRRLAAIVAALFFTLLVIGGCNKNTTNSPVADVSLNQDAAESIANAVGEDNGGVTDQMGDIADATGSAGISANVGSAWNENGAAAVATATSDSISKTFNASDTSWTIFVSRSRVGMMGRQAGFTRTYNLKFVDQNGVALPRYITTSPADTATTVLFKVLNGSGYTRTLFISTHLLSINSDFVVKGVNTTTLTANGTFTRTGVDTVHSLDGSRIRVLNYTLTATLENVTGPRTPRYMMVSRIPRATGGTITGTYTANVTVLKGDSTTTRSFTKDFTITFGNQQGSIDVDGSRFSCDLTYGELSGN